KPAKLVCVGDQLTILPDGTKGFSGVLDGADLALLLGNWGPTQDICLDLNGDGVVNGLDIAIYLGAPNPCP
ncbi:MAG: hypothetical protein KF724_13785, partial [Phycisphaeraceae bacterium]|nr:hypothetical protein [Phycisphaeraceae bacterium]